MKGSVILKVALALLLVRGPDSPSNSPTVPEDIGGKESAPQKGHSRLCWSHVAPPASKGTVETAEVAEQIVGVSV